MAQIIKHRRGTLAELNGVTLNNGELGIVTSSVASIGDAVLKTAIVVGNTDGTNRLSIGRIIKGNATPNLSGITGGSAFNDMLYHETDAKTLKVLNTGGNTSLDLTGNIAGGTVGGTLTTTGNLSVQAHISASGKITGSDIYASGGFYGDGSNLTGVAQDIDSLSSYGAATIHQTDDEFLISDDGTEKKITFSNLEDSIFANVSGDVAIAGGGAATIQATSVEGSMLNDNVISGQGALGGASMAQADLLLMDDGPGTLKSVTFSNFEDSIFANISGDIAIAAGGAATVTGATTNAALTAGSGLTSGGTFNGATARTFKVDSGSMAAYYSSSAFSTVSGDVAITSAGVATVTGATTNAALTAGVGLSTTDGTFNGGSAVTFALDLSELSDVQIASGDKLAVLDSDGSTEQLESIDDIATLFAGDGLQASSAVMAVDVSDFAGTGLEDDSSENLRLASQGTGISGGAGSTLSITPGQTAITSVYNTALKVGSAASQEYVDFSTTDEVNTKIDNTERLSVTATGIDVTGNATISGNLTVNGTQTTISSSIVDIGDNIIQVNGTPVTYGGLHVKDATGNQTGSMVWDTVNNYWKGGISGSEYRVPELASATELSGNDNRVLISDGTRIDASAAITDDGTTVDISNRVDAQASLQVTGSIYASAGASVAASSASLVSFRNDSTTQLGYLASADTQAVTTGLVGYNTSTGNLTISSVVDGGSF
jgi:hypothetical protein